MSALGIIGGGQLGMMLAEAATLLPKDISKVTVLDPISFCPASTVGARQIIGAFDDENATMKLAKNSDIITYEFEGVNVIALENIIKSKVALVEPAPLTLAIIKDKLRQKKHLVKHNIPVADFIQVTNSDQITTFMRSFGRRAILKARQGGYDGKGNLEMKRGLSPDTALAYFDNRPVILERKVNFEIEISVIIARNTKGQIAAYPAVENIHESGILRTSIAPARTNKHVMRKAKEIAVKTLGTLTGAGVFGIEMFVTHDGGILVNEIAPRVHNSGHHTLQSCTTSQFEQHLRAIFGLELGNTEIRRPTIMHNILGPDNLIGKYIEPEISDPNIHVKMYKKNITKPLRKLGHANIVGAVNDDVYSLLERLESIKHSFSVMGTN